MAIAYKSAGAGGGTETSGAQLALACPAVVAANDILIAHVIWLDITSAPTDPSGWDLLYGPADLGTGTPVGRSWVYGRLADGTEDGTTINFGTAGGTAGRYGRIYSFDGYVSGTIDDVVPAASFSDIPSEDDPPGPTVTTTVAGALAIGLLAQDDNNTVGAWTGMSGGTWTRPVAQFTSTSLGAQGCMCAVNVATPTADPGTISGGGVTTVADEGSSIGFEIRPNVAPPKEGDGAVAVAVAVAGTGHPIHKGSASVAVAVALSATGERPPKEGSGAVDVGVAISATGNAVKQGSGAVAATVAISASGTPTHKGQGDVPVAVAISGSGTPTHKGQADVPVNVAISATGKPTHKGQASIVVGVAIAGTGQRIAQGSAAVVVGVAISATGQAIHKGQATVVVGVAISGTGQIAGAPLQGQAAVVVGVAISGSGAVVPPGPVIAVATSTVGGPRASSSVAPGIASSLSGTLTVSSITSKGTATSQVGSALVSSEV